MLNEDRRQRLLESIAPDPQRSVALLELCTVAVEMTEVTGAGIMLMTDDQPQATLCATNSVSGFLEEVQLTFGEGPSVDAVRRQSPASEPDLDAPITARWPAFSRAAVGRGVRAVFGFPIQVGTICLGSLNLYRDVSGSLTTTQHDDATAVAVSSAHAIVASQANAAPGSIGAELEPGTALRFVVHQATGMVAAQLGVGVEDALMRLRAYAFAQNRLITEVAQDIVGRQVRLSDDGDGPRR